MSHTLTQPEEVAIAMMELESVDGIWSTPPADKNSPLQTSSGIPNYGYVSPYRVAYIRSANNRSGLQL